MRCGITSRTHRVLPGLSAAARIRLDQGTLTVDDEGPGIAPGDREHVFERFYRSQESRSMPGSGLGLSIVRQVIERHSGNVRVDENGDGGTRMVLQIPGAPLLVT